MKLAEEKTLTLPKLATAELMEAVLAKGGRFSFRARGASMAPFVRNGDTITIGSLANQPPRLGDVVAFSYPIGNGVQLVVHRIVGRRGANLLVQGDANGCTPEIISLENILGRLIKVERNGRHVRLGLGLERPFIAWLSRTRLLWKLIWPVWQQVRQLFKG